MWATGVLKPTTSHVGHRDIEEDHVDDGMPEPRLEYQVPEAVDRSNLPKYKFCSTAITLRR